MNDELRRLAEGRIRQAMQSGCYVGEHGQLEQDHKILAHAYFDLLDENQRLREALAQSERPTREEIMSACHSLIAHAGGLRKAATACGEHPSNFVSIVKGRRRISRSKLRKIVEAREALKPKECK